MQKTPAQIQRREEASDVPRPFSEHLADLRRTIIECLIALGAGWLIALPLAPRVLTLLRSPLQWLGREPDYFLRSLDVGGAFSILITVSFWTGLLLAAPIMLISVTRFVAPGLRRHERRVLAEVVAVGLLLFVTGVIFGYRVTLPAALRVMFSLHDWLGIRPEWTITSYVSFAVQTLLAFGLGFELPAILWALARLGLVSHSALVRGRPYAFLAALVLGAFLTPPDVVSQLLMAVPLLALYEVCVWVTRLGSPRSAQ